MNEELFSAAARGKRSKKWESIRTALPQELHAGVVGILIELLYEFIKDGHYEELFKAEDHNRPYFSCTNRRKNNMSITKGLLKKKK